MSIAEGESRGTRFAGTLLSGLAVLLLTAALVLLSLHSVSYGQAKAFFDQHFAAYLALRHGNGYLTEQNHERIIRNLPIAAGIFGISGLALMLLRRKLACFLVDIPREWKEIRILSFHRFCQSIETRLEWELFSSCLRSASFCVCGT